MRRASAPVRVAVAVLLPSLLFGIGQGAALPMIAVAASHRGADLATAGLIAALPLIGQLAGNLPAGWLVARLGEDRAMIVSAVVTAVGASVSIGAPTPAVLAIGVTLMGLSASTFALARQVYITVRVDFAVRGRAFSTVAGANRLGMLIGPFVASGVLALTHYSQAPFGVVIGGSGLIVVAVTVIGRSGALDVPRPDVAAAVGRTGALRTMWRSRRTLATIGVGAALLSAMRGARTTFIPLAGVGLGLTSIQIATLVGVAALVDFLLFYPGGYLMDRFGRLGIAVFAMIGFGSAFGLLSLTYRLDHAEGWLVTIALSLGTLNGLTSGIIATMGADLADPLRPTDFLAGWRLTTDLGTAAAPLTIAGAVAAISLPAAAAITGGLGYLGATILWFTIPRFLPARRRSTAFAGPVVDDV